MNREGEHIRVIWAVRFHSAPFTCVFDLRKFPFDNQNLVVRVSSTWDEKTVQFRRDNQPVREIFEDYNLQDYEPTSGLILDLNSQLKSHRYHFRSDPGTSGSAVRYSSAYVIQRVRRYPGFYLFNLYLPTFLICSFAFCAFAFTPDDFASRASIIVTVLLTVVAFKQAIKQYIPQLPYQTSVDRYILAGLSVVVILAIEMASLAAAAVCVSSPSRKPTLCGASVLGSLEYSFVDGADFICLVVTGGLWLFYQCLEGFLICRARSFRGNMWADSSGARRRLE